MALALVAPASASTISGTISFQGNVVFPTPIAGISFADMVVSSSSTIEAVGNGEHCTVISGGSAAVDGLGAYPDGGTLSVAIEVSRGGGNPPDDGCIIQLRARGDDGGAVSASGSVTVEVTAAEIVANATVVTDDIVALESRTQAGLDKDCHKWVKTELKRAAKCNAILLKLGGTAGALKCKVSEVLPVGCFAGPQLTQTHELSAGQTNQYPDPPAALGVDKDEVGDQMKCQKSLGKAGVNYFLQRIKRVQKYCVDAGADDEACRLQASKDSSKKLDTIDKCVTAQATDSVSGLTLGDVGEPCRADCITAGTLDRKCLKTCFGFELDSLSDGQIGDVPECGNGIVQSGEACDDGGLANGDCCSSTCTAEAPGSQTCGVGVCETTVAMCSAGEPVACVPGTPGAESSPAECTDALDNDCDGLVDAADGDCPP